MTPFVSIQKPCPEKSKKGYPDYLLVLMVFLHVFPNIMKFFPQTWQANYIDWNHSYGYKLLGQCHVTCVKNISRKSENFFISMNSQIDSVGSVMCVKRIARLKKHKLVVLQSPFWNFSGQGFWILTKGIVSQPVRSLPCPNTICVLGISQHSIDIY